MRPNATYLSLKGNWLKPSKRAPRLTKVIFKRLSPALPIVDEMADISTAGRCLLLADNSAVSTRTHPDVRQALEKNDLHVCILNAGCPGRICSIMRVSV